MSSSELELQPHPKDPRSFDLWLQHAAGRILFEDIRSYALERIHPEVSAEARAAAVKAIDHAVYGLMMVVDGVSGAITKDTHAVELSVAVKLLDREAEGVIAEMDLSDGDGMCMGRAADELLGRMLSPPGRPPRTGGAPCAWLNLCSASAVVRRYPGMPGNCKGRRSVFRHVRARKQSKTA